MMSLSSAAKILDGNLGGHDAVFTSVSSDTRSIEAGALFVAIEGEKLDGHAFLPQAAENGAVGAIVRTVSECDLAQIEVPDTTLSLGCLAANWRKRFSIPVIAITGSNGKTTVTSMVASILSQSGPCLSPAKSFNNQWGVPLTLLQLRREHLSAVIEMGTNQEGEIEYLAAIAEPTISMINNVGPAHLEGLRSEENIASAKSEIYSGLSDDGIAVINLEDRFSQQWIDLVSAEKKNVSIVTFGRKDADVTISSIQLDLFSSRFVLSFGNVSVNVTLPLPGTHNAMNALAAATISHAAGSEIDAIKSGLESVSPVNGRLNCKQGKKGATIIDDSYNANPQSIRAAIDVLGKFAGRKILVLGRMAELGQNSELLHRQLGEYAKFMDIDQLVCLVEPENVDARAYCDGFGDTAISFTTIDDIVDFLESHIDSDVTILVKGSRSAQMERVVDLLVDSKETVSC